MSAERHKSMAAEYVVITIIIVSLLDLNKHLYKWFIPRTKTQTL